jgi:hypothetical protein
LIMDCLPVSVRNPTCRGANFIRATIDALTQSYSRLGVWVVRQVAILEADRTGRIAQVFGPLLVMGHCGSAVIRRELPGAGSGCIARSLIRRYVRTGTNPIGEAFSSSIRGNVVESVGSCVAQNPHPVDRGHCMPARATLFHMLPKWRSG